MPLRFVSTKEMGESERYIYREGQIEKQTDVL